MTKRAQYSRVRLEDDGTLVIDSAYDGELARLPGSLMAGIGMFDEAREGFSYELDSEVAAGILSLILQLQGYKPRNEVEFTRIVTLVCSPGPGYEETETVFAMVVAT